MISEADHIVFKYDKLLKVHFICNSYIHDLVQLICLFFFFFFFQFSAFFLHALKVYFTLTVLHILEEIFFCCFCGLSLDLLKVLIIVAADIILDSSFFSRI